MAKRTLVYVLLAELVPAKRNPKRHDLPAIAASMERFGVIDPIVEDGRTGRLIAGHGRMETLRTAELAGLEPPDGVQATRAGWKVPLVRGWRSRNDAEARAALVAVNHLTETGGWDIAELYATLDGIDLTATGYTPPDLERMLATLQPAAPAPDVEPTPRRKPPKRTRIGDVWQLGQHRLICGDARHPATFKQLLDGRSVNMAFTSPPYAERREYDPDSGFMPIKPDDYVDWFEAIAHNVAAALTPDGSWFINIKENATDFVRERYVLDLAIAHCEWGWLYIDQFVWPRPAFPLDPHTQHRFKNGWEPVWHFARARDFKFRPDAVRIASDSTFTYDTNNRMQGNTTTGFLGVGRDNKEPGLAFPSNVLPGFGVAATGTDHPAAYPVGLPLWFVRAFTDPGDVVLDPFAGSGSTLLAAEMAGRVGYAIELSPAYCDMVCQRWQLATDQSPIRAGRAYQFA